MRRPATGDGCLQRWKADEESDSLHNLLVFLPLHLDCKTVKPFVYGCLWVCYSSRVYVTVNVHQDSRLKSNMRVCVECKPKPVLRGLSKRSEVGVRCAGAELSSQPVWAQNESAYCWFPGHRLEGFGTRKVRTESWQLTRGPPPQKTGWESLSQE